MAFLEVSIIIGDILIKRIKTALINGVPWMVRWAKKLDKRGDILGRCHTEKMLLEIAKKQSDEELVDTICHEVLHASAPDLTEEAVYRISNSISDTLLSMGLRFKK